jgi:hypothetical protein
MDLRDPRPLFPVQPPPSIGPIRLAAAVLASAIEDQDVEWFLRGDSGLFSFRSVATILDRADRRFVEDCWSELGRHRRAAGVRHRRLPERMVLNATT